MVSVDDHETNTKFAQSLDADFPFLSDPEKFAAIAYGVVDDERIVPLRWTFIIGPNGKILSIDKNVRPETSGEDLAANLSSLGVAKK